MINKRILIFAILISLIQLNIFPDAYPDIRGFDKSIFEYHFSRAHRETKPELWMAEARAGIDSAIRAWELFAFDLYENPYLLDEAKKGLIEWSDTELEERYFNWLYSRFFGNEIFNTIEKSAFNISEIHKVYMDESVMTGDNHSEVHDKWLGDISENSVLKISDFNILLANYYPELLAYISKIESIMPEIAKLAYSADKIIKTEFNNIILREERFFINRITGRAMDSRYFNDFDAAANTVSNLISEAERICNKGIEDLNCAIEAAAAGTGDLNIRGENWLELYKQQFEYGLKVWQEAEERFFIKRLEWEQDSLKLFSDGNDAWLTAYTLLEEERRKWELKIKELMDSGEAIFKNASANLEKAINDAKIEFEYNLQLRAETGTENFKTLIDIYLFYASGMSIARENCEFASENYTYYFLSPAMPEIFSVEFDEWLYSERMSIWKSAAAIFKFFPQTLNSYHEYIHIIEEQIIGRNNIAFELTIAEKIKSSNIFRYENFNLLLDMEKYANLHKSYSGKIVDVKDRIISEYFNLFDSGILKDVLSENVNSEDFFLDEYQIALIKAKALVQYWERQSIIADAVSEYADKLNSGENIDNRENWEAAKKAYEDSVVHYEIELNKLNLLNTDLIEQQKIINLLVQRINIIEEEINQLNMEYNAIIYGSIENRYGYLLNEFKKKYDEYSAIFKKLTDTKNNAISSSYIESLINICNAQNYEAAMQMHNMLLNGNGEDFASYSQLIDIVNVLANLLKPGQLPQNIDDFGFDHNSYYYFEIGNILNKRNELLELAIAEGRDTMAIESQMSGLLHTLLNSYKIEEETNLHIRKAALQLFSDYPYSGLYSNSDYSYIDWYIDHRSVYLPEIDKAAITIFNLPDFLIRDIEMSNNILLEKSREIENANPYYFITENESYFIGNEIYMINEIANYNISRNMLELYSNFYSINRFSGKAIFEQTVNGLQKLYANYNINTESILPSISEACTGFISSYGYFIMGASQFLFDLDKIVSLLPDAILSEIDIWKDAFIENMAAIAVKYGFVPARKLNELEMEQQAINDSIAELELYFGSIEFLAENDFIEITKIYNEIMDKESILSYRFQILEFYEKMQSENDASYSENRIHWRQYINSIPDNDEYAYFHYWYDGKVSDLNKKGEIYSNFVNSLLEFYGSQANNTDSIDYNELIYDELIINYNMAAYNWQSLIAEYFSLEHILSNLGISINYSTFSTSQLDVEKSRIEKLLNDKQLVFAQLREEFFLLSNEYMNDGMEYDSQYTRVKSYFDNIENSRFQFEIQDAIQTYNFTSYVNGSNYEKDYSHARLERAKIVLEVLSHLYDEEEYRPYQGSEYELKYNEYKEGYLRILRINEAYDLLNSNVGAEELINADLFKKYISSLYEVGMIPDIPAGYVSPEDKSKWNIKDIITVKNGVLAFSVNSNGIISGTDASNTQLLNNYFSATISPDNEINQVSEFEIALYGMVERMKNYFSNQQNIAQWGLARNYLLRQLTKSNDIAFLKNGISIADSLRKNKSLGKLIYIYSPYGDTNSLSNLISGYQSNLIALEKKAWENLRTSEKADLEFYLILTLSGNSNSYYNMFSQYSAYKEYEKAYTTTFSFYESAKKAASNFWDIFAFIYIDMRDTDKKISNSVNVSLKKLNEQIKNFEIKLINNLSLIIDNKKEYLNSCNTVIGLNGTKNSEISWGDIQTALENTGNISNKEIQLLKNDWFKMLSDIGGTYSSPKDALLKLSLWAKRSWQNNKGDLENVFISDYQKQYSNTSSLYENIDEFIEGNLTVSALEHSAANAFGHEAASLKTYLNNAGKFIGDILENFTFTEQNKLPEFSSLSTEFIELYYKALISKHNSELNARQHEWDIKRKDLVKKYTEWQQLITAAAEYGRMDWNSGFKKLEDSHKIWFDRFQSEYNLISEAWEYAYLDGLLDKENWLAMVESTVYTASSEALLNIIGAEAERMSRIMDTRVPLSILSNNAESEVHSIINGLLGSPGITGISGIFHLFSGMDILSGVNIRQGIAKGNWDSNSIKSLANDLAKETNAELAALEARKLAANIQSSIDKAILEIVQSVNEANMNFSNSMDDMFIINGQWRKSGKNYIKDIIVNSTLFETMVTERKTIPVYTDYVMEPINLETNLKKYNLADMDSYVIYNLVKNIQDGIKSIVNEIFVNENSDNFKIPGKFGLHIGYEPIQKKIKGEVNGKKDVFKDYGKGEQGRLLSEYYYWLVIDNIGAGKMAMPHWERPMWDDRDSQLDVPSLRTTVDITVSVAAGVVAAILTPYTGGASLIGYMALLAAINTTDDLTFEIANYAVGYKTADEALFNIGKTSLINVTTSVISGAFSSIASSVSSYAAKAAISGVQTLASGTAATTLNSVTYSHEEKWGFSREIFTSGMRNTVINTLSASASNITSNVLRTVNTGNGYEKLFGYNPENKMDVNTLNNLIGSVAGQGIQYMADGEFTLNILNLSLFTNGKFNNGLLELHLGSNDGKLLKLGSGGVDASLYNVYHAIQGGFVWDANNKIDNYTNTHDFKAKVTLRAQYGYGGDAGKKQLYDILNGVGIINVIANNGQADDNDDFSARTRLIDGKRVINLRGYNPGMSNEDQLRLAITLGHEAYRDGIVTDDNALETMRAVTAHTVMADKMWADKYYFTLDANIMKDLLVYKILGGDVDLFGSYIENNYDSSDDYWKLTRDGKLEYDGFATFRDSYGDVIMNFADMKLNGKSLSKDTSIESALLYLLNVNPNDKKSVNAVRQMMVNAGMQHTSDDNPENWYWLGEKKMWPSVIYNEDGPLIIIDLMDIKDINMGKVIDISDIMNLHSAIGSSKSAIAESMNRIYETPINFYNYMDAGVRSEIVGPILESYLSDNVIKMIMSNIEQDKIFKADGINANAIMDGNPRITSAFNKSEIDLKLESTTVRGSVYFTRDHTGVDYVTDGTNVYVPEGYWNIFEINDHKVYLQLIGSDIKISYQHLNPDELSNLTVGTVVGGSNSFLANYPDAAFGNASGKHVHFEVTRTLPYNGIYERQFVNPETLQPADRLNYNFIHKDKSKKVLPDYPMNFRRY